MQSDVNFAEYDAHKKSTTIAFFLNVFAPGTGYIYSRDWSSVFACYIGGAMLVVGCIVFSDAMPSLSMVFGITAVLIYPISIFHVTRSVSIYNQNIYKSLQNNHRT